MVYDIGDYVFKPNDKFVVDTNIWMYLYYQYFGDQNKEAIYSDAISRIRGGGCHLFITLHGVTEYVSAYIGKDLENKPDRLKNFTYKMIRKDSYFKNSAEAATTTARMILKYTNLIAQECALTELSPLLEEFSAGGLDMNDQLLLQFARKLGLKIVTEDSDFLSSSTSIDILTANQKMLELA